MDTQWNKYEVFQKERADLPHRNAGSVHAPDDEMALENARDVFARRPTCLSLWVLPERAVFAKTVEELESNSWNDEETSNAETYLVFQKQGQNARETYVTHVGQVMGNSPQDALRHALENFPHTDVFVWWVVPEGVVLKSEAGDVGSMFEPAFSKRYRNHLAYPVEPIMRQLKSAAEMFEEGRTTEDG
jgi:phenylacetate-CoA oxygenase PaaH subunit